MRLYIEGHLIKSHFIESHGGSADERTKDDCDDCQSARDEHD
jgi:hypothetical protein